MGHKEILSREIQNLSPQQAREILHYVGYIKSLADIEQQAHGKAKDRRTSILAGFRKLRELDVFEGIDDPVQWQRDMREDRPLL